MCGGRGGGGGISKAQQKNTVQRSKQEEERTSRGTCLCSYETVDKYGGGRSSSEQLGYGPVQGPGARLCIEAELGEAEEIPRAAGDVITSDEDDDAGGGGGAAA
ncbi:unnamed protein product [Sphagnum jensenii]|uniref:Uncharacterized protein n=1 Tax=Sphagnum jensenii TaxID=128206 RepID=A0ABP1BWS0_9BRYO